MAGGSELKIDVEWRTMDTMKPGEPLVMTGARPAMPGAGRMAVNFTRAAVRAAVGAMTGQGLGASENEIERRRVICHSNECGYYVAETERCRHARCGCFLRAKRWLKSSTCPDGRW